MTLHSEIIGSGPRLVLVHGFTQTGRCWGELADRLATSHQVVSLDAPGHGLSGHRHADLAGAAELAGEVGGKAHYVGYSMGGRILLHLALARPDLVEKLTLIGANPGIEDEAERAERVRSDQALAERIESEGLDVFLDFWLELPLFGDLTPDQACRTQRLNNTESGLASSLRLCGTGSQEPLWGRVGEISVPTLYLAGERDEKFTAIGHRTVSEIGENARFVSVPDTSHSCHLERPDLVASAILAL